MNYFIFVLILGLFSVSCSPTGSDPFEKPLKPSMVKRTTASDTGHVERGIDADASEHNDIVVMWYKHPEETNLEKYKKIRYIED